MPMTTEINHIYSKNQYHLVTRNNKTAYFVRQEKLCYVLVALFVVLPSILLVLRICKKLSEYRESRQYQNRFNANNENNHREISCVSTTPVKQDYINLAPPCYSEALSAISTYELPPPYSPTLS